MESIIAVIFAIIMIVAHIIKSIREAAEVARQQQRHQPPPANAEDELIIITRPKQGKQSQSKAQPKPVKQQRPAPRRELRDTSFGDNFDDALSFSNTAQPKRQALSRKLAPQGEGERFGVDPGTLDTANIISPTIDPTVKPELESITGIYEEGAQFSDGVKSAITLNIADYFAKPEGVVHAVVFAEILNRPAWRESQSFTELHS